MLLIWRTWEMNAFMLLLTVTRKRPLREWKVLVLQALGSLRQNNATECICWKKTKYIIVLSVITGAKCFFINSPFFMEIVEWKHTEVWVPRCITCFMQWMRKLPACYTEGVYKVPSWGFRSEQRTSVNEWTKRPTSLAKNVFQMAIKHKI